MQLCAGEFLDLELWAVSIWYFDGDFAMSDFSFASVKLHVNCVTPNRKYCFIAAFNVNFILRRY